MAISQIETEEDYKAVMREVSAYFDNEPEPGTPEGNRLEALVSAVQTYEAKHWPITPPTAEEAAKFRQEQMLPAATFLGSKITPK